MEWALAAFALLSVAALFRRILHLDQPSPQALGFTLLSGSREQIYQPVAQEMDTQALILAISLNEALGERAACRFEKALGHVELAVSQWRRLAAAVIVLLNAIDDNLPNARLALHVRNIGRLHFNSRTMAEFVPTRVLFDQLIFRSKVRYQIRVRLLRGAVDALASSFTQASERIESLPDQSAEAWKSLDPAFHDFDLIIKEALLYMRSFLFAIPDSALQEFAGDVQEISRYGVRSTVGLALR